MVRMPVPAISLLWGICTKFKLNWARSPDSSPVPTSIGSAEKGIFGMRVSRDWSSPPQVHQRYEVLMSP